MLVNFFSGMFKSILTQTLKRLVLKLKTFKLSNPSKGLQVKIPSLPYT